MLPPSDESDDERYTRYEITDETVEEGMQKNLGIIGVQDGDGERYQCGDLASVDSSFFAEVIVINGRYISDKLSV